MNFTLQNRFGLQPAKIVLGTAGLGSSVSGRAAYELLDSYLQAGGNCLDSAHVYAAWLPEGDGVSEKTIGAWLKNSGCREEVIIMTKGGHPDMTSGADRIVYDEIRRDLLESLDRLQTDHIDIYWLHRDDPAVPLNEIAGWMQRFMEEGLIGCWGGSNWTVARMQGLIEQKAAGFIGAQTGWSLATQNPGTDAEMDMHYVNAAHVEMHRAWQLPLFAYTAQAKGFFSGKYNDDHGRLKDDIREDIAARYDNPVNRARLARVHALAQQHDVSMNAIALQWLLARDFPVYAVVGPGSREQVLDACSAAEMRLPPSELDLIARLDNTFFNVEGENA